MFTLDVRAGDETRKKIEFITKDLNFLKGSKYMRPTESLIGRSYQKSWKPLPKPKEEEELTTEQSIIKALDAIPDSE